MSPFVLIGGSIFLLGIGAGLGYLLAHRLLSRDAKAVSEVQEELDAYRKEVTEHFGETAQHFQALGQQYQSLYRHLAQGAGTLCDPTESNALLEFSQKEAGLAAAAEADEAEVVPDAPMHDAPIDYVAEQDEASAEPEPAEAAMEAAEAEEVLEEPPATGEVAAESPAEEVSAEPVPAPEPRDGERTVH